MKLIISKDENEMAEIAVGYMLSYMYQEKRVNLAITGGTTPVKMYEKLIPLVKDKKQFSQVHYYNFDEIPYRKEDREGVTISTLRELYFSPAHIDEAQIHKLDQFNYASQDQNIAEAGGLDMIVMGVGADGHFCGNMPGTTKFGDSTTRVECDEMMKKGIRREFTRDEDVPDYYITMGPRSIMQAKHLVMIACGKKKAPIIKKLVEGVVDPNIPSSLLTLHPHFTLILDEEAASEL